MEERRRQEEDGAQWAPIRRGWFLGDEEFRRELLARVSVKVGEHHAGELRRQSAQAKAEGIIVEELKALGWTESELRRRHKGEAGKLRLAARLRRETTLPIKWIAARLHMGTWRSASVRLQTWKRKGEKERHTA